MSNTLRDDIYPILECFYDIPLVHACKFLSMSAHTLKKLRLKKGIEKWPFDEVRRGTFRLNWAQIQDFRHQVIGNSSYEMRSILEKVDLQAHVMRKIFTQESQMQTMMQSMPVQPVPSRPEIVMPRPPITVQRKVFQTKHDVSIYWDNGCVFWDGLFLDEEEIQRLYHHSMKEAIQKNPSKDTNEAIQQNPSKAQKRKRTRKEYEGMFIWEDINIDDGVYGTCTKQEVAEFQALLHENGYDCQAPSQYEDLLDDEGVLLAQTEANKKWLGIERD